MTVEDVVQCTGYTATVVRNFGVNNVFNISIMNLNDYVKQFRNVKGKNECGCLFHVS